MKTTSASLFAFSATAISFWAPSGYARQNDDTQIVTANRFQQPVNSVLASGDVVTREDIERWQVTSLTDVMRRLPGVDIAQNGGMGQLSSLFIRGTNSSHVLILIDGIRLNQAGISGSSDLSQIPLSLVQRIEYIRGSRSAVYGSDAIGGVINIITGRASPGTTLTAGVGSNGYQNYEGATQQKLDDATILTVAGNYTYTRGYDVVANLPDIYGDPVQKDRDGFMNKTLYGLLEHQFTSELSGFVRGYGFDNRTAYDGTYSYDNTFNITGLNDTRQLYSQTWDSGLRYAGDIYSTQLIASYSRSKDYNYDPRTGRYGPSTTLDDSSQYNLQWGNTWRMTEGTLSAGIDWQKQTTEPGTAYVQQTTELRNTGIYATGQQHVGAVTFEAAVRGDDNSQFGWHGTWQGGAAWEFVDGYSLFANYATAYKAPNPGQLYGAYGNSALHPEESRQWEGGLEGLSGVVTWRVSGYRNNIDNLIDSDPGTYIYYNINKVRIKGVEATASFDTGPFAHHLSYDYVDARNASTNQQLARRAKQQMKYQLDWTLCDLDWSVTYHYLGERYDSDFNHSFTARRVQLGGVSIWDLAVSYPVTSMLTVRGRIANLFDKDYETVYGYPTPGTEYYLSASYSF